MYGIKSNHFIHHHTHGLRGGVLHLEVLIWCGGSEPGQSIDHDQMLKNLEGAMKFTCENRDSYTWLKYIYFFCMIYFHDLKLMAIPT